MHIYLLMLGKEKYNNNNITRYFKFKSKKNEKKFKNTFFYINFNNF